MKPISLGVAATTVVHALGTGVNSLWAGAVSGKTGLRRNSLTWCDLPCWVGAVPNVDEVRLPEQWQYWDCRNHRLAWMALQDEAFLDGVDQQVKRFGSSRIGLVLGTSTSGIRDTEMAYAQRKTHGAWPSDFNYRASHSADAICRFIADVLRIRGPAVSIVTACTSSAKVFLTAQRWISAGLIDAAIVGGCDSLCLSTLHGFDSLQLLSDEVCRPFDAARNGISIGEAAGFALLTRSGDKLRFLGGGESSDAWHLSTPHPDGLGAKKAMRAALDMVGLAPEKIDYINAHGTATRLNDRAEAIAVQDVFRECKTPISSTKGVTGHTLGAAGIVEAIVATESLARQILPPSSNLLTPDADCSLALIRAPREADVRHVMTNNFGFGGTNCSLIFGLDA